MRRRLAVLGPADVQRSGAVKFHLRPFQVAEFDRPQPVTVGHEDQRGVPMPVAAFPGGTD
jgi:hypothetical protein